eukprot:1348802-Ditylum_brightwellii.AAC.1
MKVTNPFVTTEDIAVIAWKVFASTYGYANKTAKWNTPENLEEALADELKRNTMTFSKVVIC